MIQELRKLYDDAFSLSINTMGVISGIETGLPTNPMLIDIPEDYATANIKIMAVGQETNDWEGAFPHPGGVTHLMNVYRNFCIEGGNWRHGGQYWNGIKQFKCALDKKFQVYDKSSCFVYNNIVKIGKSWGRGIPQEKVIIWEDHWFKVITKEVDILKPNIVLFFTGPNYDIYIAKVFGHFQTEPIGQRSSRQLARIVSNSLPKNTFRTYHPNFLWRNGFYNYLEEVENAIDC